jgi:hypothetical protein
MIQRITRDTTSGEMLDDLRAVRKVERRSGVVGWRERRWTVHNGILNKVIELTRLWNI